MLSAKAWGDNTAGELGDGSAVQSDVPAGVANLTGITSVSAGDRFTLALMSNGTVMAWGDNQFGQLGDGTQTSSAVPVAVRALSGVAGISAGSLHSLAVLRNGTVEAWGQNGDGQLGNGSITSSDIPVAVSGISTATAVAAGGQFSLALLADGSVEAWGDNESDQLGNGGQVSASFTPVVVENLKDVTAISAGYNSGAALTAGAVAMDWGQTGLAAGQAGVPVKVPLSHVAAVAAGGTFGMALLSTGQVATWGQDDLGQLGDGEVTGQDRPPAVVAGVTGVRAISAGDDHAAVILPATPPTATGSPISIFTTVPAPDPDPAAGGLSSEALGSVSAASAADALAVGDSRVEQPFAEHWNGTSWTGTLVPVPKGRTSTLQGVADVAPGDGWAVGDSTTTANAQDRTLIEHWNGTAWTIVPSPNPAGGTDGNDALDAIAAVSPTDIWAAGDDFTQGGSIVPLFEHYNGTSWATVPAPPTLGGFATGLAAVSASDVWMVGTTLGQTISAHWDGHHWTAVPLPQFSAGPNPSFFLGAVSAVSSSDVWATGFAENVNNQNFQKPFVLHWNGTRWALSFVPNPGVEGSELRGITALSAHDVFAVGETLSDGSLLTLAERFNGTTWTAIPSPDPGFTGPLINSGLTAAGSARGLVWAVGFQNRLGQCCDQPLAMRASATGSG